MKWHNCKSCETEFRVVSDSDEHIDFCPFCGSTIEQDEEEEEIEDDFD